jgi:hypothetical protein
MSGYPPTATKERTSWDVSNVPRAVKEKEAAQLASSIIGVRADFEAGRWRDRKPRQPFEVAHHARLLSRRDLDSNVSSFEDPFCPAPSPKAVPKGVLEPCHGWNRVWGEVKKKWPDNTVRIGVFACAVRLRPHRGTPERGCSTTSSCRLRRAHQGRGKYALNARGEAAKKAIR